MIAIVLTGQQFQIGNSRLCGVPIPCIATQLHLYTPRARIEKQNHGTTLHNQNTATPQNCKSGFKFQMEGAENHLRLHGVHVSMPASCVVQQLSFINGSLRL